MCRGLVEKGAIAAGTAAIGLQNLGLWDRIKHGAEHAGEETLSAAEKCGSNAMCRGLVEKGAIAAGTAAMGQQIILL